MLSILILGASAFALFWIYFGYGITLWMISGFCKRAVSHGSAVRSFCVVVPVHNEEHVLERKLRELLSIQEHFPKMTILVVDGASTDETARIAERFEPLGIRLLREPSRRGKLAAVLAGARATNAEVVAVTDANSSFESSDLAHLLAGFAPDVGGVTARLIPRIDDRNILATGTRMYWAVDAALKRRESGIHSCVGLLGELFAVRREPTLAAIDRLRPNEDDLDDTFFSTVLLRSGFRLRMTEATVAEDAPRSMRDFLLQKRHVYAGNIAHALKSPGLLGRGLGWYSMLIYPTRRLIAPCSPLFVLGAIVGAFALSDDSLLARAVLLAACTLLTLGVMGLSGVGENILLVRISAHFVAFHAALISAWYAVCRRVPVSCWTMVSSTRLNVEEEPRLDDAQRVAAARSASVGGDEPYRARSIEAE